MCEKIVVPNIPSITDVASEGTREVQQVSDPVEAPNMVSQPAPKVKRAPVDHQTSRLYWPFIILMGKIAHYANEKYGSVEQYADGRLEGEKSPINHIAGHIADYVSRKPHDKFGNLEMQLAAIAYNAMMECVYLHQDGEPTVPSKLYDSIKPKETK